MDVIHNQLNLALEQVQTVSAERQVASTIGLQAQQDLVKIRLIFHEVVAEKEHLNQAVIQQQQQQIGVLQPRLNNAISLYKKKLLILCII